MKILAFPFPLLSHYLRTREILRKLPAEHQVLYAGDCEPARKLEQLGEKTFQCEQFDASFMLDCTRRFDFSWLNSADIERVFQSQADAVERLKPDLIVSDSAQTARMVSERCGVPHLSIVNGYMTKYYALTRRLHEGHPAYRYQRKVPSKYFDPVIRFAERHAMRAVHRPFTKLREKYRLPRTSHYLDELEGSVTAVADLTELFPQRELPRSFRCIGPAFYSGEPNAVTSRKLSKPRVVCSMGSSGEWGALKCLADPLFDEFELIAIGRDAEVFHSSHVEVVPFADPQVVLTGASLVICHGGNGTMYQALSYGVPVLCLPTHFEQAWNIERFKVTGAVISIERSITADALKQLIHAAMELNAQARLVKSDIERAIAATDIRALVHETCSEA